jgi:NADPH:quinone reductase-like Zn-dependent oxidoreductase
LAPAHEGPETTTCGRARSFQADSLFRPARFQADLAEDLGAVFGLLGRGAIRSPLAARLDLGDAAEALRLHESGEVPGKVLLIPGMKAPASASPLHPGAMAS